MRQAEDGRNASVADTRGIIHRGDNNYQDDTRDNNMLCVQRLDGNLTVVVVGRPAAGL